MEWAPRTDSGCPHGAFGEFPTFSPFFAPRRANGAVFAQNRRSDVAIYGEDVDERKVDRKKPHLPPPFAKPIPRGVFQLIDTICSEVSRDSASFNNIRWGSKGERVGENPILCCEVAKPDLK